MKKLSFAAQVYILSIILVGLGLIGWLATVLDWSNSGLYLLCALGAVAQTLKVEGPDERTNYSLALGILAANLLFVLGNHFLVGLVVKLARGLSFAESAVLGFFTLFLDFTVLSMGAVTALLWQFSPLVSVLNILPLYLLYNAIRVPALKHQLEELKELRAQAQAGAHGD